MVSISLAAFLAMVAGDFVRGLQMALNAVLVACVISNGLLLIHF